MIRTAAFALAFVLSAAPASAAERSFSVTDFDRVQVEGPYEVVLLTGRPAAARAAGSVQALEGVRLEVQGGQLRIRRDASAWGPAVDRGPPLKIYLATRDLRGAAVLGAGHLSIDRMRGLRSDMAVSGSGRLEVGRVESDNLLIGLLGSGRIAAAGTAGQVKATIQGSGDLAAPGLAADDLVLNTDTAGRVAVAARRTAKVRASGAGDVEIGGAPACTVTAIGAGQVRCGR